MFKCWASALLSKFYQTHKTTQVTNTRRCANIVLSFLYNVHQLLNCYHFLFQQTYTLLHFTYIYWLTKFLLIVKYCSRVNHNYHQIEYTSSSSQWFGCVRFVACWKVNFFILLSITVWESIFLIRKILHFHQEVLGENPSIVNVISIIFKRTKINKQIS